MKPLVFAIDFDGTCTTHEFPEVGKDIGAVPVLKKLVEKGHKLILYTMRCNHEKEPISTDPDIIPLGGNYLQAAEEWFSTHNIPLYGVQQNPGQGNWTSSPKCYANVYIDDAALGCPLKYDIAISERPFVDWKKVKKHLTQIGIL
jgi:hypothetical protein